MINEIDLEEIFNIIDELDDISEDDGKDIAASFNKNLIYKNIT